MKCQGKKDFSSLFILSLSCIFLITYVSCSFQLNSRCEYNHASFVPDEFTHWTQYREAVCFSQKTKEDCDKKDFCWWRNTTNQNKMAEHLSESIPPSIHNPAPGVYVAVGFDLANTILIINDNQTVIIDTLTSTTAATIALSAIESFIGHPIPPITAIFYTHSHGDHFGGTTSFPVTSNTLIYAHSSFFANLQKTTISGPILKPRANRQFAAGLQAAEGFDVNGFLGNGIGPFATFNPPSTPVIYPNRFFDTKLNVTLAGLEYQLFYTPGETDDTITIFVPSLGVVCVGDNVYKSFSNLYAIRGTPPRDVRQWYRSVDLIRSLNPKIILGSHSAPITDNVQHILTTYRDAIAFVHDQTIILFNKGIHPDDIAATIQLPEYLANEPFLQEFYGFIPWCAKSVFVSYIGWFSGDIAELEVVSTYSQAKRLVDLAGGVEFAIYKATDALNEGTLEGAQWALTLATAINRTLSSDSPHLSFVFDIYVQAAQQIAYQQPSTNGRNYYLQTIFELKNSFNPSVDSSSSSSSSSSSISGERERDENDEELFNVPLIVFMEVLAMRMNYSKTKDILMNVRVNVKDNFEDVEYVIVIRREVLEVYPSSFSLTQQYDCNLSLNFSDANSFKSLILSFSSVQSEIENGNLLSENPLSEIAFFFSLFQ